MRPAARRPSRPMERSMIALMTRSWSPAVTSVVALGLALAACAVDQTALDGAPNGPPPPLTEGQEGWRRTSARRCW